MRLAKLFFDDACLETALRLQEERAMRPGRGYEHYWYISAALSLAEMQFQPAQADELARKAVDRVAKLLYKVLSLWDDPSEETLATEVSKRFVPAMYSEADKARLFLRSDAQTCQSILPCRPRKDHLWLTHLLRLRCHLMRSTTLPRRNS